MNFTALDFETANYSRESICSVGIAVVENGKITQTLSRLVRPTPDYFRYDFIDIHGITQAMTRKAPVFAELWPEIEPYLANRIVVAHNAGFDIGALRGALNVYRLPMPKLKYYCTVQISRKAGWETENHKLSTVCEHLGIPLNHHDAESDAVGAASILLKAAERHGVQSLKELVKTLKVRSKKL